MTNNESKKFTKFSNRIHSEVKGHSTPNPNETY